jgi:hypothetical protein
MIKELLQSCWSTLNDRRCLHPACIGIDSKLNIGITIVFLFTCLKTKPRPSYWTHRSSINIKGPWWWRQYASLKRRSTPRLHSATSQRALIQGWPNSRSRPLFFKIAYLKHNLRCKLGMHELPSAERNARYRRFFELLINPPGLYQVILNLLSVSYRKICSVIHNRKVSEKHLLIVVNCFSLKISVFNKRNSFTFICLMMLCYFTFHCLDLILNYVLW